MIKSNRNRIIIVKQKLINKLPIKLQDSPKSTHDAFPYLQGTQQPPALNQSKIKINILQFKSKKFLENLS